jgi:hypothetical protein
VTSPSGVRRQPNFFVSGHLIELRVARSERQPYCRPMSAGDENESSARHRGRGRAAWGAKLPRLTPRQWGALLISGAAIAGFCAVWANRWDATESEARCTVAEVERVLVASKGPGSVWRVTTEECGVFTLASAGGGSGISPSSVEPGSRYDLSLRGWD